MATVVAGALTAIAAWLGGVRSGKAQFITAASTAADLMLSRQSEVIARMEGVIQRQAVAHGAEIAGLRAEHQLCNDSLAEVREQLAVLRVAAQLPPWEPKKPTKPEGGQS